jgi:thioredoxin reductase (NADPH)
MSTIHSRDEQMFPKLTPHEIDRLRRFGEVRRYAAGEPLFVTGDVAPGMFVLIKGSVRVTRRDPLEHSAPVVEQGPSQFVAEVGQLSGQPAFVDVHAIDEVEALLIPSENLRSPSTKVIAHAPPPGIGWRAANPDSAPAWSLEGTALLPRSRPLPRQQ